MYIGKLLNELHINQRQVLKSLVDTWLDRTVEMQASDIDVGSHGCEGSIWMRVFGFKRPCPDLGSFSIDETDILVQSLLMDRQREHLYEWRNLDFSYMIYHNGTRIRFRGDMYFDFDHLAMNMRRINDFIYPFKDLGFHPDVAKALSLTHVKQGLILITGITGSGKSTTLDSIIDANNKTVDAHVVIIGSPIENIHNSNKCLVRHREVGRDVMSFKEGAVQALRQDPDIIVIGEMRDPDTILTSLEITDSGHKVFSTLHTGSAVESIDRIIAECPTTVQDRVRMRLADVLTVIVSQKLVPSVTGKLQLAKEVLLVNSSVRAAIKNNNTGEIYQMIFESQNEGMITIEQDLYRLYRLKNITKENAMNFANNKKRLAELLRREL
ncbi:MAG: Flp pilus assembly complex ATPase component TadA [Candidatus Coatesbacteria bacterium]|nr:Flp pilus assembly complex ATPase component TadA [Candidatus Coatesbacteria bacterium]